MKTHRQISVAKAALRPRQCTLQSPDSAGFRKPGQGPRTAAMQTCDPQTRLLARPPNSRPEHRGTAMGYAGQFWGVAQLVVPITFGFVATSVGLENSLYLSGFLFIGLAVLAPVVYRVFTRGWMLRIAAETEASSHLS